MRSRISEAAGVKAPVVVMIFSVKTALLASSCKMLMPPSSEYAVSLHVKWTRRCPLLRPPLSCTGLIKRGLTRGGSISIMGTLVVVVVVVVVVTLKDLPNLHSPVTVSYTHLTLPTKA